MNSPKFSSAEQHYLEYYQAKKFFAYIFEWDIGEHSLVIRDKNDTRTWRKLIKRLNSEHPKGKPEHERRFLKDKILQFFATAEFIRYYNRVNFESDLRETAGWSHLSRQVSNRSSAFRFELNLSF